MPMTLKPTSHRVLIRYKPSAQSVGGIILPDNFKPNKTEAVEATVVDIGPAVTLVNRGDEVIVQTWTGKPVKFDGVDYYLMPETDILAIGKLENA